MGRFFSGQQPRTTVQFQRGVSDPTGAMQQILSENESLKNNNAQIMEQLSQALAAIKDLKEELSKYSEFKQIVDEPIGKLTFELDDETVLKPIRGLMIRAFGPNAKLDSKGKWIQSVQNERLNLVIRQVLVEGIRHSANVLAQLDSIKKEMSRE